LERLDLGELEGDGARDLVSRQLTLHGFDRALEENLREDLAVAASTPLLPGVLPPLVGLDRDRQLRELEFTLAVSQPNLRNLAELLRDHGATGAAPEYWRRLERVGGQRLRGFLRGFIDLMFEWDGRWYVADYKSNRLSAYEPPEVLEAVQREHYVLQGLLYSAAAHRHLQRRLPEYDPERHWGGALFLFLRGMVGPRGAGSSVFCDRQTPALLDALDHWLGGRDGSR
jgi:exodeoxyribonuclease V beta subunit